MNHKRFNIIVLITTLATLMIFMIITIVIDPYFHYHAPLASLNYKIHSQRYQNNGIVRNFSYDAIITGTSMTENFKTSEFDKLFDVNSIKVPYSGGLYKEINDNILIALSTNPNTKLVLRCLDYSYLITDKDAPYPGIADNSYQYPYYIIDKNPFNDISYLLNKSVFFSDTLAVLERTKLNEETTSFDDYAHWSSDYIYGQEAVLSTYTRPDISKERHLLDEEKNLIKANLQQNVLDTAIQYPNTTFYIYFPPLSICYWDQLKQNGQLISKLDAEQIAIEELLRCDNIMLFSFANNFDLICDLDNYKDYVHYGEWINSDILQYMSDGEYQLTKENYLDYMKQIREFYNNYEYEQLFQ